MRASMQKNQRAIRAVYMRGGTSKGVFFHAADLPPAGPARDAVLLRVMGSPDPLQIDGMGGTYSSTSKVVVVDEPRNGVIPYSFGQVAIDAPYIDWHGNCGNLTTAVGPFAIEEGLVPAQEGPVTTVRLLNNNTNTTVVAEVPVAAGTFQVTGDHVVDGVPGTGSPVVTKYLDPAGKTTGSILPLGPVTEVALADGQHVVASVVDAASVYAFVRAADLGVNIARSTPAELNADVELLEKIEQLRGALAVTLGRVSNVADAATQSATVPRVILFAPGANDVEVYAYAVMMGVFHRALPMTGALCTAAAAHLPGTILGSALQATENVTIGHPKGKAVVAVETGAEGEIEVLGVTRTARRIFDGQVYI